MDFEETRPSSAGAAEERSYLGMFFGVRARLSLAGAAEERTYLGFLDGILVFGGYCHAVFVSLRFM